MRYVVRCEKIYIFEAENADEAMELCDDFQLPLYEKREVLENTDYVL